MSWGVCSIRASRLPCLAVMVCVVLLCSVSPALAGCNHHRRDCQGCLESKDDCCYDLATEMCFSAEAEELPRVTHDQRGTQAAIKKCAATNEQPLWMRASFFQDRNNCGDEVFVGPAHAVQRLLSNLYHKQVHQLAIKQLCSGLQKVDGPRELRQWLEPRISVINAELTTEEIDKKKKIKFLMNTEVLKVSLETPEDVCADTAVMLREEANSDGHTEVLIGPSLLDQGNPPLFACVKKNEGARAVFELNLRSLIGTGIVSRWCDKEVK